MNHSAIIIGAGLAGLSAAITLAENGKKTILVSNMPSERAQSVLAAGGINAALNLMGEDDSPEQHFADTMRAGCDIEDPDAVHDLTESALDLINRLAGIGVPFQKRGYYYDQRQLGGQKKRRTLYVKSSTGKMLMSALISEAAKYEASGMIERISSGCLIDLLVRKQDSSGKPICSGCVIMNRTTNEIRYLYGPVLLAVGGLNGMFGRATTGSVINTADAAACAFAHGVAFSDLEFIQYHPTTVRGAGKRFLISEAARGEGGRLFVNRGKDRWYFMEETYPELGNLMPRDVVSREMYQAVRRKDCGSQVYLDMTEIPEEVWDNKLSDLREECRTYLQTDPAQVPVPVEPGIHYFMGGIYTDREHRTNVRNLYAAGECAAIYHGANRLGGNSTLGAVYGGRKAARTILQTQNTGTDSMRKEKTVSGKEFESFILTDPVERQMQEELLSALGIIRNGKDIEDALSCIQKLEPLCDTRHMRRILLAEGMLLSALFRKETRGAHVRSDFAKTDKTFEQKTIITYRDGHISIRLEKEWRKNSGL